MRKLVASLSLAVFLAGFALAANFISGTNTCPASGNKQVIAASTPTGWYIIQAPAANTGNVTIGNSAVTAGAGLVLVPGASLNAPPQSSQSPYNLNLTYFACANTADSITYGYTQ